MSSIGGTRIQTRHLEAVIDEIGAKPPDPTPDYKRPIAADAQFGKPVDDEVDLPL